MVNDQQIYIAVAAVLCIIVAVWYFMRTPAAAPAAPTAAAPATDPGTNPGTDPDNGLPLVVGNDPVSINDYKQIPSCNPMCSTTELCTATNTCTTPPPLTKDNVWGACGMGSVSIDLGCVGVSTDDSGGDWKLLVPSSSGPTIPSMLVTGDGSNNTAFMLTNPTTNAPLYLSANMAQDYCISAPNCVGIVGSQKYFWTPISTLGSAMTSAINRTGDPGYTTQHGQIYIYNNHIPTDVAPSTVSTTA